MEVTKKMFDALLQYEDLLLNPAFVALIVTFIVNILGYVENRARDSGTSYAKGKLIETLAKYEVFIPLLSFALPMEEAVVGALLIDVATRVVTKLKTDLGPQVKPEPVVAT